MANVIRIGGGSAGQNLTLPPMVANLAASTGDQTITLTWTNPVSDVLAGVLVVYNADHIPEKVSDGTKVDAGLAETVDLTGLTNETLYYIRVFPYNEKKQYQTMLEGATVTATPDDFPAEPTEYTALTEFTSSNSYVIPEMGWFRIDVFGKCGNGTSSIWYSSGSACNGPSGGQGGYARSELGLNKNDVVNIDINSSGDVTVTVKEETIIANHGENGQHVSSSIGTYLGGSGGDSSGGNVYSKTGASGTNTSEYRASYPNKYPGPAGIDTIVTINNTQQWTHSSGDGSGIDASISSDADRWKRTGPGYGSVAKVFISRGNTNILSPSAASTLSLTPRNASIEASWTNSEDPESVGTLLVSNPTHEPQNITDGTAVDVAEATSYTLTNLPNDKPTYISLFSYNADKSKYSAAKSNVEIPREVTWADTVEEAQQEAKEATDKAAVAEEQAKQANETLQAKTEELAQTSAELTEKQVMVDSATATFNALIISDIQNDTKVISDNMILDNVDMLSTPWEVGTPNEVGDIVWYMIGDVKQYYKVVQPTNNADPNHTPNIVPAVFVAINKTNAGTIDDPIPAVRGMEYEYGKYYLDNEDGKIYICKRGEETGTIVLQYLPHELIGHYFKLATLTE